MSFRLNEIPGKELSIIDNGAPVLTYCYGDSAGPPYFHPIYTPNRQGITGGTEIEKRESQGVYFTCGTINGKNRYNTQGYRKMRRVIATAESVKFELLMRVPDPMFIKHCYVTVHPCQTEIYMLDMEIKLNAPTVSVMFEGDTGLGYNAVEMEYRKVANANGRIGEAEVNGQFASWCTLSGIAANEAVGVAILTHPDNGQTRFEAEDAALGFLKACTEPFTLEAGEMHMLKYRVLIYAGDIFTVDIANYYQNYCQSNSC